MSANILNSLHRINYLTSELDALYHQAASGVGLADSTMLVLYTIYDNGGSCLLRTIYQQSGISKQTVNSAIRRLESDEILYLTQFKGKSKQVFLTEKGKRFVEETVARIYEAESRAFASWTEEEVNLHVRLLEKYVDSFRTQLLALQQDTAP